MNKYTDLKAVAYALQAIGVAILVVLLLAMVSFPDVRLLIIGLINLVTWYAMGGVLHLLIDIARSVRASAVVAIEQERNENERRKAVKAKPKSDKPLGLKRLSPEKRKHDER